jgi:hygromycin-B 7''-O-kinase
MPMMAVTEYSKRLGPISSTQLQAALDHFNLGKLVSAEAIPFGLFGQNVFVTSTAGEFVLRGAAHYAWQFPEERFVARLLHEQTTVPVPWPYLLDTDEAIFGWKYGYVIMPRMPGLQLADRQVLKTLTSTDRTKIAYVLGKNLREIQKVTWRVSGRYDLKTGTIKPFKDGFATWLVNETRQLLQKSATYGTGVSHADTLWIEEIIDRATEALAVPFTPVLVLHDYKEANLTAEKRHRSWRVSGVFDLMEALFGDGELDLARQLSAYMEEDIKLAGAFLNGYQKHTSLRSGAKDRLALYITLDRLYVWEYFHRPEHLSMWWYDAKSVRKWMDSYLTMLDALIQG